MIYTVCDIDKTGPDSVRLLDGDSRLTPNWSVEEVACKDGSEVVLYSSRFMYHAQLLRDVIAHALRASSWFRTWTHNKKWKGVSDSRHMFGIAADFTTPSYMSGARFEEIILKVFPKGTYTYVGNGFVHVDGRGWEDAE